MERIKMRNDFAERGRWVNKDHMHEVTVAVKHLNLDSLEQMVLEKSTPSHPSYQKWMTFEEVGSLTSNIPGYFALKSWFEMNHMEVFYTSKRFEFMKVRAKISHWESVLRTEFFEFKSLQPAHAGRKSIPRAKTYHIPAVLREHLHCLFHVSHLPPLIETHGLKLDRAGRSAISSAVGSLRATMAAQGGAGQPPPSASASAGSVCQRR